MQHVNLEPKVNALFNKSNFIANCIRGFSKTCYMWAYKGIIFVIKHLMLGYILHIYESLAADVGVVLQLFTCLHVGAPWPHKHKK